ncbi:MAG: hypothetical protein JWR81_6592 [Pseudonocardia sp.]|nr:hypothetical protein [Pseudonocardia sp.]MDT7616079.1 hypothetical protein [Pseudonocardiales bacterium]
MLAALGLITAPRANAYAQAATEPVAVGATVVRPHGTRELVRAADQRRRRHRDPAVVVGHGARAQAAGRCRGGRQRCRRVTVVSTPAAVSAVIQVCVGWRRRSVGEPGLSRRRPPGAVVSHGMWLWPNTSTSTSG